ncbi:hypothetical protein [Vibrio lentus]|uniref:hypothetical protein n=1 Tax=Vibrio lentus TaxID=136468 RepID=UPI000975C21E|nr:hypothetical protein [Vibrio lentus]OMO21240.1 hypothetical protein BH583_10870 [Vibrio lentus]PMN15152.1 hypothetical protein BCT38_00390 [Vibrio lentus]
MNQDLKKLSSEEVSKMYGNAMENSIQRNATEGELERRKLFWIKLVAIVTVVSVVIMGLTAVGSFVLELLSFLNTES